MGEGNFSTPAAYSTGNVQMTNGSTTVLGVADSNGNSPSWSTSVVGQQLYVRGVVFTVTARTSSTQLTVDKAWGFSSDGSSGQQYVLASGYLTPAESDFQAFYSVIDPFNGWRLRLNFSAKEIDRFDPRRNARGTPYLIAARSYDLTSTTVPRFELWPVPTTLAQYRYIYEKYVPDLSSSTDTPFPIIRSDVLVKGGLADLARWPGTETVRNPSYDLALWRIREQEFQDEVRILQQQDQNIYLTDLTYDEGKAYPPLDSNFIQSHAF